MPTPYYEDDLVTRYQGDSLDYCEIAARRLAQDTLFGEIA